MYLALMGIKIGGRENNSSIPAIHTSILVDISFFASTRYIRRPEQRGRNAMSDYSYKRIVVGKYNKKGYIEMHQ
jgi:hypothetical protein